MSEKFFEAFKLFCFGYTLEEIEARAEIDKQKLKSYMNYYKIKLGKFEERLNNL
jgi:hypothetical protein